MEARAVHVRDLRNLDSNKIWKVRGRYDVTFDDGVTKPMSGRHIKLSWPYWGMSRFYPNVPTPSTLCYQRGGEWSTDDRHLELMSQAALLARKAGIDLADTRYILSQHVYADAFNLTVKNLLSFCTTIDIDTLLQIYDHPEYQIIHEWMKMYPSGYDSEGKDYVNEAYIIIDKIIKSPELFGNPLAMSVVDKTLKLDQVLQAFVRGKTSEIDSRVYTNQVWEGFFTGLNTVISRLKESGATSRAHLYNTDKIAEAEYGSRKLQLAANVLTHFTLDDCGTTHWHNHTFRDNEGEKAKFSAMVGMRYRFVGETGEWRVFEKGHFEDVVDKPLHFRTAMSCLHMRKQGVCAVCMGDLVYNLSEKTSPGHLASTSISEKGTQGILSTKHLDFLRYLFKLVISGRIGAYFDEYAKGSEKGLHLKSKPEFGNWDEYVMVVNDKMHSEISQVAYYDNLDDIDETSLPDVTDVTFTRLNKEGEPIGGESLDVRMGVCGNFSKQFLAFFLKVRDKVQYIKKGEIRIPLAGWKTKQPFLVYTNRSESMAEFVAGLETKLRSIAADKNEDPVDFTTDATVKMGKDGRVKTLTLVEMGGSTEAQCTYALFDTFRYIKRKLSGIPMTHIAIMLAISRVESPTNPFPAAGFDSEEAVNGLGKRFLDHNTLIAIRSAAPMFFFQGQQDNINQPGFFTDRKIPASLYDGSFKTRLH
ncbi:RNA polymerase beta subunit [Erwinia phage vB_EamM_ChrisDB]|uniref:RNA polymerase beta subunit n=1 Tax=Erwinia phage vB_EamM_ChrisDB TaxID=1883371 RepID=UPI00081C4B8E|nr:RNA polymerase beta subunit [Erwinia phage vB_EamM_ChrisDB]ANZ48613.1 putative DNA-directed RNA polymerase beta subunit [Erwinia phage vB_EamM_ChrisDB]